MLVRRTTSYAAFRLWRKWFCHTNQCNRIFAPQDTWSTINMKNYPFFGIDNAEDKGYFVSTVDSDY